MKQNRIILFLTTVLTLLGLITYFIMPREEDPRIKRRNAITSVVMPGASPEKIQRLVVRPIEDELLKVQELKTVEVEIRLNVAVFKLELKDSVKNVTEAWLEVDRALDRSQAELPPNMSRPILDFSVIAVESIVLAVTGSDDLVQLLDAAKKIKDSLLLNPQVSEIKIFGDPSLEVLVSVNVNKLFSNGISIPQLLNGIQSNNRANETGLIIQNNHKYLLQQDNDVSEEKKIGLIKFETGQLDNISLSEMAEIKRQTAAEPRSLFRWNGQPAIGLGVVAQDSLNIVNFGEKFLQQLEKIKPSVAPFKIEMVAYQPDRTQVRLNDLMFSLFSGMALVAVFLALTSGFTMALIVTMSVPVISAIGLFIYFLNGGVLHQISIAAFVISIGQFIDNIIVVVDSIQQKIEKQINSSAAALETSAQLKWPMAFATLTGICAFLPMLSSEGPTADFTFSLPQIAIITLITSYFVSLYFVPVLAEVMMKKTPQKPIVQLPFALIRNIFVKIATGPLWKVGVLVLIIFSVSVISLLRIKKDFFPESDRSEFLFSIELSPNSDILATDQILKEIEAQLKQDSRVESVASFSGGNMPRFYYNLPNPQKAPQVGQLLITTKDSDYNKAIGLELEKIYKDKYPDKKFTAQFLQQGPPVNAKIEVNIFTENPKRSELLLNEIQKILLSTKGTRSVRADATNGLSVLNLKTKEQKITDIGLNRNDLNSILAFYSSGAYISQFRYDRNITPIVVRDEKGLYKNQQELIQQKAFRGRSKDYYLNDLLSIEITNEAPILRKENGQNFLRILTDLQPGFTFSSIMQQIKPQIDRLKLDANESITYGGDAKGASEANNSIFRVVPLAITLLILFLLIEFKSFKKLLVALLALPVTIMGVFPGLWLGGAPFGFMSLLGLLALVGIAINNIILLMEAFESEASIAEAIQVRFRAIILTTLLTLLGLIPLALEKSPLWPPLAWTMISGLLTGTMATLIVLPALYRLFFETRLTTFPKIKPNALSAFLLFSLISFSFPERSFSQTETDLNNKSYTLDEMIRLSENTAEFEIQNLNQQTSEASHDKNFRDIYVPKVYLQGQLYQRDKDWKISTPFGESLQEEKNGHSAHLELRQTLFDYSKMNYRSQVVDEQLASTKAQTNYLQNVERVRVASEAIEILILERELKFIRDSLLNLSNRLKDVNRLIAKGRLSLSDSLKLEVAIEKLKQQEVSTLIKYDKKKSDLGLKLKTAGFSVIKPAEATSLNLPKKSLLTGDIESVQKQSSAVSSAAQQVKSASLPTIDAYLRTSTTDGNILVDKQWNEAGVMLRWEIFGGGVRQAEARELTLQSHILQKKYSEMKRTLEVNFNELKSETERNFNWIKKINQLSDKAAKNKNLESLRYYEGRGNLNDLVEADNLQLELMRDKDIINLQIILGCMQLKLWSGQNITADCK